MGPWSSASPGKELASEPKTTSVAAIAAKILERCTVPMPPCSFRSVADADRRRSRTSTRVRSQYRGDISCRIALGESRNTAAMRAGTRAGIKNVIDLTYRSACPKDPKHALQPYPTTPSAHPVNPLSMAATAAFLNGGFRVTPRFANDVCRDSKSLLYTNEDGDAKECDFKGENPPTQERLMHPAVSAAMIELLKSPLDIGPTGTASALRTGVIPGMDPLSDAIWKLKPDERKKRALAFPFEQAGEIAGKTGTATNADGKTSDVWLLLFLPGPPEHPDRGIVLGFWMGKDSKDHPLGSRGATGGPGFAESGARNWVHSAATVLAFLQKERGLLQPGYKFQPITTGEASVRFGAPKSKPPSRDLAPAATPGRDVEGSDPPSGVSSSANVRSSRPSPTQASSSR